MLHRGPHLVVEHLVVRVDQHVNRAGGQRSGQVVGQFSADGLPEPPQFAGRGLSDRGRRAVASRPAAAEIARWHPQRQPNLGNGPVRVERGQGPLAQAKAVAAQLPGLAVPRVGEHHRDRHALDRPLPGDGAGGRRFTVKPAVRCRDRGLVAHLDQTLSETGIQPAVWQPRRCLYQHTSQGAQIVPQFAFYGCPLGIREVARTVRHLVRCPRRTQVPGRLVKRLPALSQIGGHVHVPADSVDGQAGSERGNPPALFVAVRRELGDNRAAERHVLPGCLRGDARFGQASLAQRLTGPEYGRLELVQAALVHPPGACLRGPQAFVPGINLDHGTSVPDRHVSAATAGIRVGKPTARPIPCTP